MSWAPVAEIAADVNAGKQRAVALVAESLKRIEQHKEFKAIIAPITQAAHEAAVAVDARVAAGENAGRLAGVPFIAKDNFLVFGADTTAASNILKGFDAPYQATAIERLEAEGAICVAKANMDAFGHGASTENSDLQVTKNPHDPERVPGGSSGGSAAAIALDLAPFSLATDTGGSIRQPASFCGVVGLKPSYGLVSRSGVVAMISSTDCVGVMSRKTTDIQLLVEIISGQDPLDGTTIPRQQSYLLPTVDIAGKKIGLIKEYYGEGLDSEVRAATEAAIEELRSMGAKVSEISIPSMPLALAVYYIICPAEVSSNLARYDGQRYGFSDGDALDLDQSYEKSRQLGFGAEAKRRIMIGTHVLSSGYYDAYYKKAQIVRTKIINEFNAAFEQCDFLVGPVAPTAAFKAGENTSDPLAMYLGDIMTVAPSLAGIPSISVPCKQVQGMPVGLQIMAPQRKDAELLQLARTYEESNNG